MSYKKTKKYYYIKESTGTSRLEGIKRGGKRREHQSCVTP